MNEAGTKRDLRDHDLDRAALEAALEKTWKTPSGLWGALATVDHKIIGRRYIFTAFVFLALGRSSFDPDAAATGATRSPGARA